MSAIHKEDSFHPTEGLMPPNLSVHSTRKPHPSPDCIRLITSNRNQSESILAVMANSFAGLFETSPMSMEFVLGGVDRKLRYPQLQCFCLYGFSVINGELILTD